MLGALCLYSVLDKGLKNSVYMPKNTLIRQLRKKASLHRKYEAMLRIVLNC